MTDADRLTTPDRRPEDLDAALRPKTLDEFVGQRAARENLRVFIEAAKGRGDALDHVLFFGPPGLGKTTLAQIIARELGVGFRATSGPVIAKSGDLAALLTNLEDGDVLFIDEIPPSFRGRGDTLSAMEDRRSPMMGKASRARCGSTAQNHPVGATPRQAVNDAAARPVGIPVRRDSTRSKSGEGLRRPPGSRPRPYRRRRPQSARRSRHDRIAGACSGGCATSPQAAGAEVDAKSPTAR